MDEETRKKLQEWSNAVIREAPEMKEPPAIKPSQVSGGQENPTPIKKSLEKKQGENKELLKRIRTYETDAAEHIRNKKASISSIAIAEQGRAGASMNEESEESGSAKKQFIYAILSLLFIATGAGILYGWYIFAGKDAGDNPAVQDSSLVSAEEVEIVLFDYADRPSILSALSALTEGPPVNLGGIYEVKFVQKTVNEAGEETRAPISTRTFLEALSVAAPISLFRSLEPEFGFGVLVLDENYPFMIIKTSFYQNAFASMLAWENTILDDLSFITKKLERVVQQTETLPDEAGTSSSEGAASSTVDAVFVEPPVSFKDLVVQNHDTRVAKTEAGETAFLYAFPQENLLIITSDEKAFEVILDRMKSATFSG